MNAQDQALLDRVTTSFAVQFGHAPDLVVRAPGRVNSEVAITVRKLTMRVLKPLQSSSGFGFEFGLSGRSMYSCASASKPRV